MKSPFKKLYKKALDTTFSKEELKNSTRISKSATPKYTTDWYVKWVASAFVLAAMSLRGIPEYQEMDLIISNPFLDTLEYLVMTLQPIQMQMQPT